MKELPGSTFSDNVSTDAKYYDWFHACTAATIMDLCRTGYVLSICNGIQLSTSIPLFGFFGKVCAMDCQNYDEAESRNVCYAFAPEEQHWRRVESGFQNLDSRTQV